MLKYIIKESSESNAKSSLPFELDKLNQQITRERIFFVRKGNLFNLLEKCIDETFNWNDKNNIDFIKCNQNDNNDWKKLEIIVFQEAENQKYILLEIHLKRKSFFTFKFIKVKIITKILS